MVLPSASQVASATPSMKPGREDFAFAPPEAEESELSSLELKPEGFTGADPAAAPEAGLGSLLATVMTEPLSSRRRMDLPPRPTVAASAPMDWISISTVRRRLSGDQRIAWMA